MNETPYMVFAGTKSRYLAEEICKELGCKMVYISTDYVFGEEPYNIPCREEQQGTPTGVYGQTKLHGEQLVVASGCRHVIIRTAWLYSTFGNNFTFSRPFDKL